MTGDDRLGGFQLWPRWLDVSCLTDATRERLHARYERLDTKQYAQVLKVLKRPFAGPARHNEFVRKTEAFDEEFGKRWQDCIPELADEMVLLPE